jgi:hypothetical protein
MEQNFGAFSPAALRSRKTSPDTNLKTNCSRPSSRRRPCGNSSSRRSSTACSSTSIAPLTKTLNDALPRSPLPGRDREASGRGTPLALDQALLGAQQAGSQDRKRSAAAQAARRREGGEESRPGRDAGMGRLSPKNAPPPRRLERRPEDRPGETRILQEARPGKEENRCGERKRSGSRSRRSTAS